MKKMAFREEKQHGSSDFPIAFYRVDASHPQYVMPLHWHRESEIVRVLSGQLRVFLNNEAYLAQAGSLLFVPGGVLHRAQPEDCVYECVVFDWNLLGSRVREYVLPLLGGDKQIRPFFAQPSAQLAETVDALCRGMEQERHRRLAVYAALANLLNLLYTDGCIRNREISKRAGHQTQIITTVINYIDQNFRERITLQQLGKVAAVHEKYLCRLFKEYTGRTPIEYVNQLRIDRACIEMTAHHKNVTEAALDVGFTDMSYFTKLFKRCKGVTPSRYARGGHPE